jgi:hypothetical protein
MHVASSSHSDVALFVQEMRSALYLLMLLLVNALLCIMLLVQTTPYVELDTILCFALF